ncbi:MAG: hypothetical protein KA350_06980 [Arenimonas sp.]|nr:hypothetical protein [Arenimonas sp.]
MNLRLYQHLLFLLLSFALIQNINTVAAQTPEPQTVDHVLLKAQKALQVAASAQAPTLASEAYLKAQESYQQALAFQTKRKAKDSARVAAIAIRYAELATRQAEYIQLKNSVEAKVSSNAELRRTLLLGQSVEAQ